MTKYVLVNSSDERKRKSPQNIYVDQKDYGFHPRRGDRYWVSPPKWSNQGNKQNMWNTGFQYTGYQAKKTKNKKQKKQWCHKQTNKKNSDAYKTGTRWGQLDNCPNSLPWETVQAVELSKWQCYKNTKIRNRQGENICKSYIWQWICIHNK